MDTGIQQNTDATKANYKKTHISYKTVPIFFELNIKVVHY